MKTFLAFTTGLMVGMIGIATAFLTDKDIQKGWNALAETVNK